MSCSLTRSRAEACKDSVAGIKEIYLVDFGGLGTVTLGSSDEVTDITGSSSNAITAQKYELKGNNSFETSVQASRENGTVFFEQTLNITLKKLTKEDHKELKLLSAGRPHIFIRDKNDNILLMGRENGADLTEGTVSTGNALGDFNGYNYTFVAQESTPPNFCTVGAPTVNNYPLTFSSLAGDSTTIGTPVQV